MSDFGQGKCSTVRFLSHGTLLTMVTLGALACSDDPMGGDGDDEGTQWNPSVASLVGQIDRARFVSTIEMLASFGDRTQGSASYDAAAAWVTQELESFGYEVDSHPYQFQGEDRESLFVTKVGETDPHEMVIVSAHLDGRGGGGAADDDGSGSALVIELARVLGLNDISTGRSVRFILWNNEETGLNGSSAYVADRAPMQGVEDPPGSGLFPEPAWIGMIQHDMILFDHGLPVQPQQIPGADVDIEYQITSDFATASSVLADLLHEANEDFADVYPAQVGTNMRNTDSWPFRDFAPAVSVRENQRVAEIGNGANPHWHQPTDVFATYSDADFDLGLAAAQGTLAAVIQLVGAEFRR